MFYALAIASVYHHLLAVLLEPVEFPSTAWGLSGFSHFKKWTEMQGKGTVELVMKPGPGCYSNLFLVQKAF